MRNIPGSRTEFGLATCGLQMINQRVQTARPEVHAPGPARDMVVRSADAARVVAEATAAA
jgi:hypothetical protein